MGKKGNHNRDKVETGDRKVEQSVQMDTTEHE